MVTYSNSFLTFLKDSRSKIAKTLYKAYLHDLPSYRFMLTTQNINYLALRADGNISYLPAGKGLKYNADGQWSREGRQDGKPAKVIRKLFTKKALSRFKDADFEGFANAYKAKFCDKLAFELRTNRHIQSVYDMVLARGDGSLNNSCMNCRSHQLNIYRDCEILRILVLINEDGFLCGRALVWSLEDDITLLDRIYVVSDFMYELFICYALDNQWWHKKEYRSADDKDQFINDKGEEVTRKFVIKTPTSYGSYPYIDTFTYGNDGWLMNYDDGRYTYENADGTRTGDHWDEIEDCTLDDDDAVYVTHGYRAGIWTDFTNTVNVGDQVWWRDDPGIAKVMGTYYRIDDTVWSEYDDIRYLKSDCIWSEVHDSYILTADSVTVDGKIYHADAIAELQRA
jgi:hypothetical protein